MHEHSLLGNEKKYFDSLHSNVRKLVVLQNKLNIKYETDLTDDEIINKVKECYAKRSHVKKMAIFLEYRTQLAMAKEEAEEMKAAAFLRNMNLVESHRILFNNIRHMEGKLRGGSTTQVTVTDKHRIYK